MTHITFVTPCAPYHDAHLQRAIASVNAQTITCAHIVIRDDALQGAGAARNRGLAQVQTPFVVFLDADDWVTPDFAEKTLRAYDGRHYVYTDWYADGERRYAPSCAWQEKYWHVITALLPTGWARAVGGFNEALAGAEDTLFYVAMTRAGMCGKRLGDPLFHYSKDGQRAKAFMDSAQYAVTMKIISDRYGDKNMSCCGNADAPIREESMEVLVTAQWNGNRREVGRVTHRKYERAGWGKQMWVDARDVDASPHLWRRVDTPAKVSLPEPSAPRVLNGVQEIAQYFAGTPAAPPSPPETGALPALNVRPNIERVLRAWAGA